MITDNFAFSLLPDCSEGASSAVAFAVPLGAEGVLLVVVSDDALAFAEHIASVARGADSSLVAPSLTQVAHWSASAFDVDSSEDACVAVVVAIVVETVVVLSRCYVSVGVILVISVIIVISVAIVIFVIIVIVFLIIFLFDFSIIFIIFVIIVFVLIVFFFDFVLECCSSE